MGPAAVELLLLAHVSLSSKKLATLREYQIQSNDFLHHAPIYDFIADSFSRTGRLPAIDLAAALFPSLPLGEIESTAFETVLHLFLEQVAGTRLTSLLGDVSTAYAISGDASDAHRRLIAGLPGLAPSSLRGMAYTDHQAPERWDDYRMRQEEFASTSLIGTKTGLAVFDAVARGWEGGELAGIIARPYVGKSWVLCHSAATAYREQKRILFVSPEMSRSEIGLRADQLLFPSWEGNQHHDTLPLQELITGQLPGRTEVTYKAWLESFSRERRWVTVDALSDRGIRVNLIDQLIVSYEPDLVCIDGLMLLDSPYESTWEKAKDIAYTLKNVASHRRIPILFVAQSNRMTRERNDIPSLNEIAYGDAIGQACDRVVGLGMPATGAKTVRLLQCQKFRNGWIDFHRRQAISFSPDVGDVGRIVSDLQQDDVTLDDDPNY